MDNTYQDTDFEVVFETDTDKLARIEKLRSSVPIEITGNEVPYSDDLKKYRKNALEYGRKLRGKYTNKDGGEVVELTSSKKNGGLKEVLQHDYQDTEHIQSIAAIPQIIENAIFIVELSNEDIQKHPTINGYRYYVCGLKIGYENYIVKSVICIMNDGHKYYDHRLTHIEKGKLLDLMNANQKTSIENSNGLTSPSSFSNENSLYKDKRLFSILQIKCQKISAGLKFLRNSNKNYP
jgi:hypothetical protein